MTQTIASTNGHGSAPITAEIGDTGLQRSWGLVTEEFLPELQWDKANKVFREMGDNDPTVGAVLYALTNQLLQVTWSAQGKEAAFVEDNVAGMTQTWEAFMAEACSKLQYGWALHEIVYQLVDGKVMWRKFPIRAQDTLRRWEFDPNGGIEGMFQASPAGNYAEVFIPIEKALLFRTSKFKNNPQGRSILRSAYRSWWFKKRIEEIEAIGVERDLAGIPVVRIPAEVLALGAGNATYDAYKKIGVNLRNDEQACVMLPSDRDASGNLYYEIALMSAAGSKQMNTTEIIGRYAAQIAMCALADVILLGHENVGSYALSTTKEALLITALQSQIDEVAAVFNRHALPRLFALNGMEMGDTEWVPGELRAVNLQELADVVFKLANAGWSLFPDTELEAHFRGLLDFPDPSLIPQMVTPVPEPMEIPVDETPLDVATAKMADGLERLTRITQDVLAHPTVVQPAPINVTVPITLPSGGVRTLKRDENGLVTTIEEAPSAAAD